MSDVQVSPDIEIQTGHGEPEVAHIAKAEDVSRSYVTGDPIEALCGHIWTPTRDPSDYPVCEECSAILSRIKSAQDGNN